MSTFKAYAAATAAGELKPFEYDPGALGAEDVEIKVEYCGICHSDLSMLDNAWGQSQYPLVPGHEVAGEIVALGPQVKHLKVGQMVGLGWYSRSCMHCESCLSGDHNLCANSEQTIVGRHGGFADRVRCHWSWAIPLTAGIDPITAGPLFCGGITVFNPIKQFNVLPTDRVGVVGIGGLGHMAVQFLAKWGCHVTAFTSSANKADEARRFGAHEVIDSRSEGALKKLAGSLDFLMVTVNIPLNWLLYLNMLKPKGRLHFVGAVLEPVAVPVFALIARQRSISGSPLGSPATTLDMMEFCVRHDVKPMVQVYPMSRLNDAIQSLRDGQARYRIVLQSDF
jgi:uncharacterized zinc-type alcohol dehydrogenase-like protein